MKSFKQIVARQELRAEAEVMIQAGRVQTQRAQPEVRKPVPVTRRARPIGAPVFKEGVLVTRRQMLEAAEGLELSKAEVEELDRQILEELEG